MPSPVMPATQVPQPGTPSPLPSASPPAPAEPPPAASLRIRVRVFHDFERARNGRQLMLRSTVPTSPPGAASAALYATVAAAVDTTRYAPHVYDATADCFVPLQPTSAAAVHADAPAGGGGGSDGGYGGGGLWRIDVKLVGRGGGEEAARLAARLVCDSADTQLTGSWFGVGIVRGKTASNHGTLWRSALQMGAAMTFTVGQRYERKVEGSADIYKTCRQVPCIAYKDVATFMEAAPMDAQIVVVEWGGEDLRTFQHPKRAVYVLGSEDAGVPPALVQAAHQHVAIPTAHGRPSSLNVAAAGAMIMYDRFAKASAAKREREDMKDKKVELSADLEAANAANAVNAVNATQATPPCMPNEPSIPL